MRVRHCGRLRLLLHGHGSHLRHAGLARVLLQARARPHSCHDRPRRKHPAQHVVRHCPHARGLRGLHDTYVGSSHCRRALRLQSPPAQKTSGPISASRPCRTSPFLPPPPQEKRAFFFNQGRRPRGHDRLIEHERRRHEPAGTELPACVCILGKRSAESPFPHQTLRWAKTGRRGDDSFKEAAPCFSGMAARNAKKRATG